jgi:hypothetical protein
MNIGIVCCCYTRDQGESKEKEDFEAFLAAAGRDHVGWVDTSFLAKHLLPPIRSQLQHNFTRLELHIIREEL